MEKRLQLNARITRSDQVFLDEQKYGKTAVVNAGIALLRLYRQAASAIPCTYLSKTGETAPRSALQSEASEKPPAHVCPCPACPIRFAFEQSQKKNVGTGTLAISDTTIGPGGSRKLISFDNVIRSDK